MRIAFNHGLGIAAGTVSGYHKNRMSLLMWCCSIVAMYLRESLNYYSELLTMKEQTKIRRYPERGHYDRKTLDPILDEAMVCHVAFDMDGQTFNIPMNFIRAQDYVFIHASEKSRIFKQLSGGIRACLTVTILDGIVLSKSVAGNSLNYRSAMLFGTFELVDDDSEKMLVSEKLMEKLVPGRWKDSRTPNQKELDTVGILRMRIDDFSAKVRSGPPVESAEDLDLPYWSGVIPLAITHGSPEPSPDTPRDGGIPSYLKGSTDP